MASSGRSALRSIADPGVSRVGVSAVRAMRSARVCIRAGLSVYSPHGFQLPGGLHGGTDRRRADRGAVGRLPGRHAAARGTPTCPRSVAAVLEKKHLAMLKDLNDGLNSLGRPRRQQPDRELGAAAQHRVAGSEADARRAAGAAAVADRGAVRQPREPDAAPGRAGGRPATPSTTSCASSCSPACWSAWPSRSAPTRS